MESSSSFSVAGAFDRRLATSVEASGLLLRVVLADFSAESLREVAEGLERLAAGSGGQSKGPFVERRSCVVVEEHREALALSRLARRRRESSLLRSFCFRGWLSDAVDGGVGLSAQLRAEARQAAAEAEALPAGRERVVAVCKAFGAALQARLLEAVQGGASEDVEKQAAPGVAAFLAVPLRVVPHACSPATQEARASPDRAVCTNGLSPNCVALSRVCSNELLRALTALARLGGLRLLLAETFAAVGEALQLRLACESLTLEAPPHRAEKSLLVCELQCSPSLVGEEDSCLLPRLHSRLFSVEKRSLGNSSRPEASAAAAVECAEGFSPLLESALRFGREGADAFAEAALWSAALRGGLANSKEKNDFFGDASDFARAFCAAGTLWICTLAMVRLAVSCSASTWIQRTHDAAVQPLVAGRPEASGTAALRGEELWRSLQIPFALEDENAAADCNSAGTASSIVGSPQTPQVKAAELSGNLMQRFFALLRADIERRDFCLRRRLAEGPPCLRLLVEFAASVLSAAGRLCLAQLRKAPLSLHLGLANALWGVALAAAETRGADGRDGGQTKASEAPRLLREGAAAAAGSAQEGNGTSSRHSDSASLAADAASQLLCLSLETASAFSGESLSGALPPPAALVRRCVMLKFFVSKLRRLFRSGAVQLWKVHALARESGGLEGGFFCLGDAVLRLRLLVARLSSASPSAVAAAVPTVAGGKPRSANSEAHAADVGEEVAERVLALLASGLVSAFDFPRLAECSAASLRAAATELRRALISVKGADLHQGKPDALALHGCVVQALQLALEEAEEDSGEGRRPPAETGLLKEELRALLFEAVERAALAAPRAFHPDARLCPRGAAAGGEGLDSRVLRLRHLPLDAMAVAVLDEVRAREAGCSRRGQGVSARFFSWSSSLHPALHAIAARCWMLLASAVASDDEAAKEEGLAVEDRNCVVRLCLALFALGTRCGTASSGLPKNAVLMAPLLTTPTAQQRQLLKCFGGAVAGAATRGDGPLYRRLLQRVVHFGVSVVKSLCSLAGEGGEIAREASGSVWTWQEVVKALPGVSFAEPLSVRTCSEGRDSVASVKVCCARVMEGLLEVVHRETRRSPSSPEKQTAAVEALCALVETYVFLDASTAASRLVGPFFEELSLCLQTLLSGASPLKNPHAALPSLFGAAVALSCFPGGDVEGAFSSSVPSRNGGRSAAVESASGLRRAVRTALPALLAVHSKATAAALTGGRPWLYFTAQWECGRASFVVGKKRPTRLRDSSSGALSAALCSARGEGPVLHLLSVLRDSRTATTAPAASWQTRLRLEQIPLLKVLDACKPRAETEGAALRLPSLREDAVASFVLRETLLAGAELRRAPEASAAALERRVLCALEDSLPTAAAALLLRGEWAEA